VPSERDCLRPSATEMTAATPEAELDALLARIRGCRLCRDAPSFGPPLPHEPRPVVQASRSARICIAGQAPGVRVHVSGRPFTDASGTRLRQWLAISEDEFYDPRKVAIVGMGFCFPGNDAKGGDLPPRRECAQTWRRALLSLLDSIELMILVGRHAQRWHLGSEFTAKGLASTVVDWRRIYVAQQSRRTIPLPHPSWRNTGWLKRNPWFEAELLPALQADVASILATGVAVPHLQGPDC
jgi:uracil-DNA glycosylase